MGEIKQGREMNRNSSPRANRKRRLLGCTEKGERLRRGREREREITGREIDSGGGKPFGYLQ